MPIRKNTFDTIIVGQGLAGSLLSWQLMQRKQRVLVIDNGHTSSASRPAAGLINPVTGQRLVKTTHVDKYLPVAISLYQALEEQFNRPFFHAVPMTRLFRSEKDQTVWKKRKEDAEYQPYLGDQLPSNQHKTVQDPHGSFQQLQTGYVDTVTLLDTMTQYLVDNGSYIKAQLDYKKIVVEENNVQININDDGYTAKKLIFCEGYKATENPWFSWLPFKPAKGEILTLQASSELPHEIINAGKWLLPLQDGQFKLGSTYQWEPLDEQATDTAKDELLGFLNDLFKQQTPVEVLSHQAGVRPCTRDTAPFVGIHPEQPRLGIFNGFGSKGSLMIPYHAEQFADHLLDPLLGNESIMPEADIRRYWQKT